MKPDAGRPQFRRPEQRRCAVYTRKSSDEGLDQEFNSLDAQREACSAYVKSQSGEGWRLLPAPYDDGGCSGGTMDRPALRRLLADIEAGRIDIIVVYKIDRLTRSLTDFARMVEIFDRHGVSFVSVTQAFNTTTSMGRLTLNVLLPFARFEREVTGERIRDKIAASKAKGMWMGGVLPIGYDRPIHGSRTLVVNETEAALVRRIFASYLDLGSVHALEHQLQREGIVSKRHVSSTGRETGGQPFSRGALFHLLRNRLYLGEIRHGDTYHPGLHPAIVDATLFDAVQHRLDGNARKRKSARESVARSALTGRIFDADGHPMSPTFAYGKGGRLYRYYVSAPLQQGARRSAGDTGPRRASGPALEESLATALRRLMPEDMRMDVDPLARILRIEVLRDGVEVVLPITLLRRLEPRLATGEQAAVDPADPTHLRLELPLRLSTHRGRTEILAAAPRPRKADPVLVAALRSAQQMFMRGTQGRPTLDAAPDTSHRRRLVRLAFLAPDLQRAILAGEQPENLTLARFLDSDLPLSWAAQRRMFEVIASENHHRRV
ncbi:recombinase family protein [Tabrizicola soli]|uniref:Recombinase family protein n=1 Tax=Tabrizicola soli TaxID=2185115 RepID=A0ABV7DTG8_9RHOB|nr:recombinase family protein [Tabrizicola soli]